MSLSQGLGARFSLLGFSFASLVLALGWQPSFAQHPNVPAPHRPVPRPVSAAKMPVPPQVPRSEVGGLWMTSGSLKSYLHITNDLTTSPLVVTPVLWLSNGAKLSLPAQKLGPSETTVISINQALAEQGLAPYAELSGYVELDYNWAWPVLCATVRNVDVTHSVIFNYTLPISLPAFTPKQATSATQERSSPQSQASPQRVEGLWWKQEPDVTGFIGLINPGDSAVPAEFAVLDSQGKSIGGDKVVVSPHGTKMVELTALAHAADSTGGLRVQYHGRPNDLLVFGGLRDDATGYSTSLEFAPPPSPAGETSTVSYAELGLMTSSADPMLSFPAGTVFTPYSIVRNVSSQAVAIAPHLWWMEGGLPKNATLARINLAPDQTANLNVPALLAEAGLDHYSGSVNLVLDITANADRGAVLLAAGSVDQKNNYVFEIAPGVVKESIAKSISYWSVGNGDDTMVTIWNPADEVQDFEVTLFYTGGHYSYALHLEPRATLMFNISEILHGGIPDGDGNIVPEGVHEGSAELSGSQGEGQHILVNLDAPTYNVTKATCTQYCHTCMGYVNSMILADPFAIVIGGAEQLQFYLENSSNNWEVDSAASWSSSNPQIATVQNGGVTGVAGGSVTITASDDGATVYGRWCQAFQWDCPWISGFTAGSSGTVQVPTSLSLSLGPKTTYSGGEVVECNGTVDGPGWGYSRCATFVLKDQNGTIITGGNFSATESVPTISSNPLNMHAKIGGGLVVSGTFQDFWSFVRTVSPTPQPGQYVKARQSITIKDNNNGYTYNNLRINCLDFEYNDVTVTDITQSGSCQ